MLVSSHVHSLFSVNFINIRTFTFLSYHTGIYIFVKCMQDMAHLPTKHSDIWISIAKRKDFWVKLSILIVTEGNHVCEYKRLEKTTL